MCYDIVLEEPLNSIEIVRTAETHPSMIGTTEDGFVDWQISHSPSSSDDDWSYYSIRVPKHTDHDGAVALLGDHAGEGATGVGAVAIHAATTAAGVLIGLFIARKKWGHSDADKMRV